MNKAMKPAVKAYNDKGTGKLSAGAPRTTEQTGFQKKEWPWHTSSLAVFRVLLLGGGVTEERAAKALREERGTLCCCLWWGSEGSLRVQGSGFVLVQ